MVFVQETCKRLINELDDLSEKKEAFEFIKWWKKFLPQIDFFPLFFITLMYSQLYMSESFRFLSCPLNNRCEWELINFKSSKEIPPSGLIEQYKKRLSSHGDPFIMRRTGQLLSLSWLGHSQVWRDLVLILNFISFISWPEEKRKILFIKCTN